MDDQHFAPKTAPDNPRNVTTGVCDDGGVGTSRVAGSCNGRVRVSLTISI